MQNFLAALTEQIDTTRSIVVFALIMARVMAIVTLVPFLGGKNAPTEVKMGVGIALTVVLWPTVLSAATGDVPLSPMLFTVMMLKETFVGLVIGFVAAEIFYAVEIAGQLIDLVRGANQIQLQVPEITERSSAFGNLNYQLMLALFVAARLHENVIIALFESFTVVPINDWPNFGRSYWTFVDTLVRISADVIYVSVMLAMPVGIVCLVIEACFGLINRVAPQINAYFMAMPAKVLGGCIIFFFSISMIIEQMLFYAKNMLGNINLIIDLMR